MVSATQGAELRQDDVFGSVFSPSDQLGVLLVDEAKYRLRINFLFAEVTRTILAARVLVETDRDGLFYLRPDLRQIIRQVGCRNAFQLHSSHPAADIHRDRRGNHSTLRRDHRTDSRPHAEMDIGHGCDVVMDKRHVRRIAKLHLALFVNRHATRPGINRCFGAVNIFVRSHWDSTVWSRLPTLQAFTPMSRWVAPTVTKLWKVVGSYHPDTTQNC